MMACDVSAKAMAAKLHGRYDDSLQAITTIGQCMTKALFAGKSDIVLFWALVHAHYLAAALSGDPVSAIAQLSEIVLPDQNGSD
jgi:hypothetical protein